MHMNVGCIKVWISGILKQVGYIIGFFKQNLFSLVNDNVVYFHLDCRIVE